MNTKLQPRPTSPPPGAGTISSYRILEELGEAPFGTAYRVLDDGSGTALFVLRAPLKASGSTPAAPADMVAEARRMPRIFVPGIPSVVEVWEERGSLLLAFEEARGRTLEDYRRTGGAIDRATLSAWGSELLVLLAEAHSKGVLHRHLGESSVVLTPEGRLALTGFGLTCLATAPGGSVAPEIVAGGAATVAADLYAAGALLGRLAAAATEPILGSPDADPLAAVIARATAADPARRWSDAGEMERALRRAVEQVPSVPYRPDRPGAAAVAPRRGRGGRWPAGLAALAVAGAAVFFLLRPQGPLADIAASSGGAVSVAPEAAAGAGPVATLEEALELLERGRDADGEALLTKLLEQAQLPNPAPALEALGTLRLEAGRTAEATNLLRRAAALTPSAELYYKLGLSQAAEGQLNDALESLRAARELAPETAEIRPAIDQAIDNLSDLP